MLLQVSSSSFFCAHVYQLSNTAFLPSTFAMYASTLAFTFALAPPSAENSRRTLLVTLLYATGAIVGWPFALALAIPFVFEDLFMLGGDRVATSARGAWAFGRWTRLFGAGLAASLIFVSVHCVPSSFIEP